MNTSVLTKFFSEKAAAPPFSQVDLRDPVNSSLSCTGTARSSISKQMKGKVYIGGCWWSAFNVNDSIIYPGETITVIGRLHNTLFVQSV